MVRLQRNFCGHPQAGLLWERKNEEMLFEKGCGKVPTWECLYAHKKPGLFLSRHVDDMKLFGKKQNRHSMLPSLQKEVDLEDPTP